MSDSREDITAAIATTWLSEHTPFLQTATSASIFPPILSTHHRLTTDQDSHGSGQSSSPKTLAPFYIVPQFPSLPDKSSSCSILRQFGGAPYPLREPVFKDRWLFSTHDHKLHNVGASSKGDASSNRLASLRDSQSLSQGSQPCQMSDSVSFKMAATGTALVLSGGSKDTPEVAATCGRDVNETNSGRTDLVWRLNIRRANARLRKYQAKADKLRHRAESRHEMLGALNVRHNFLLSDVVSAIQMVQESRQRLDQQRLDNKALMKHIDHLTTPDVSRDHGSSSSSSSSSNSVTDTHHGGGHTDHSWSDSGCNNRAGGSMDNPWNNSCDLGGHIDHPCRDTNTSYDLEGRADRSCSDRNNSHDFGEQLDHSCYDRNSGHGRGERADHFCSDRKNSDEIGEYSEDSCRYIKPNTHNPCSDRNNDQGHGEHTHTSCSDRNRNTDTSLNVGNTRYHTGEQTYNSCSIRNSGKSFDLCEHTDNSGNDRNNQYHTVKQTDNSCSDRSSSHYFGVCTYNCSSDREYNDSFGRETDHLCCDRNHCGYHGGRTENSCDDRQYNYHPEAHTTNSCHGGNHHYPLPGDTDNPSCDRNDNITLKHTALTQLAIGTIVSTMKRAG